MTGRTDRSTGMMRYSKREKWAFLALAAASILMLVLVMLLMRHVRDLLISDFRISLAEIVTQNRNAIASRLQLEFQAVNASAARLTEEIELKFPAGDPGTVRRYIAQYGASHNDGRRFVADDQGLVTFGDGRFIDIAGRKYFREALGGESNLSDRIISRYDGENIFVISSPVRADGRPAGTYQHALSYEDVREILTAPLFASSGRAYIVDQAGYLVIGDQQMSENYFRELYANGNPDAARRIAADARAGRDGFIASRIADEPMFASYMPIDNTKGWYLIVTVPAAAVFPNGRVVVNLFYGILFLVVCSSALAMAYFLWYKSRQQARLKEIAFVDPVTRGDTYAKFLDEAGELLDRRESAYAIVKADVDNFKYINKFFGFEAGNQVLRDIHGQIAGQLAGTERVARITGDNFVLLIEDACPERLGALFKPLAHEDMVIYFSVGAYLVENRNEDLSIMIDKAGIAAKRVKGQVHECFAYYARELEAAAVHNEMLKHRIRNALRHDEFVPFYQPKVDVLTGRIVGCEALARWRTDDGAFIPPGEFIPISEQTGMVLELDMMIYEKALAFLRRGLDGGLERVPVSVNFSKMHLHLGRFFDKIRDKAEQYGVPPGLIEIELTESTFFDNFQDMSVFSRRLQDCGFRVSMDDFGSGYSSLNMLKNMPIDVLKIDQGFLDHGTDETRRDIIFSGVVGIARQLGLSVVVEGVETVEDVALMKRCGCRIAQGYHYSRPVPEAEFMALLAERGAQTDAARV